MAAAAYRPTLEEEETARLPLRKEEDCGVDYGEQKEKRGNSKLIVEKRGRIWPGRSIEANWARHKPICREEALKRTRPGSTHLLGPSCHRPGSTQEPRSTPWAGPQLLTLGRAVVLLHWAVKRLRRAQAGLHAEASCRREA
ncbi:hypothetical protein Droror1_Dr00021742 [Drosera rotundifolia]